MSVSSTIRWQTTELVEITVYSQLHPSFFLLLHFIFFQILSRCVFHHFLILHLHCHPSDQLLLNEIIQIIQIYHSLVIHNTDLKRDLFNLIFFLSPFFDDLQESESVFRGVNLSHANLYKHPALLRFQVVIIFVCGANLLKVFLSL